MLDGWTPVEGGPLLLTDLGGSLESVGAHTVAGPSNGMWVDEHNPHGCFICVRARVRLPWPSKDAGAFSGSRGFQNGEGSIKKLVQPSPPVHPCPYPLRHSHSSSPPYDPEGPRWGGGRTLQACAHTNRPQKTHHSLHALCYMHVVHATSSVLPRGLHSMDHVHTRTPIPSVPLPTCASARSARNEDGDTPTMLAEHHPALLGLLHSWGAPGCAGSGGSSGDGSQGPQANSPAPGPGLLPSSPHVSRQNLGRGAGDLRGGAMPVARGFKLQVQALPPPQQPPGQGQGGMLEQGGQGMQAVLQQQPLQQQVLAPQPPCGYSSMSSRHRSKRPHLARNLSLPSSTGSPAAATAARVAGLIAAESGSDAPSGSEGETPKAPKVP